MTADGGGVIVVPQGVQLPEKWITHKMLTWARQQVGLSLDQAAKLRKGLSEEKIRFWESGEESASLHDLQVLGELYDCPVGYFFLPSPPQQEPSPLDFRGISPDKLTHLSYQSRLQLRRFERLADLASSLIASTGLAWGVSLSTRHLEESVDQVAARVVKELGIASEALSKLSTDDDAFELWRKAVEGQGIFVISLRLDPGELRGASLWVPPNPPAILVNHADVEAASGRRFTLFHEYAHLLEKHPGVVCDFRGDPGLADVEQFANRFAARAILPRSDFEHSLASQGLNVYREHWSNATLDKLRRPFHASRDVVRILLEELTYAPKGSYWQWRSTWDKRVPRGRGRRGGQTKALRKHRELGSNFIRLLAYADQRSAVSKLALAAVLDMKVEQAERFLRRSQQAA